MVSSPSSQTRTGLGWLICQTAVAVRPSTASSNEEGHLSSARKLFETLAHLDVMTNMCRNDILSVYTPIVSKIEALVRRQTTAIKSKYGKEAKVSSPK
jgi:hypothetical protein